MEKYLGCHLSSSDGFEAMGKAALSIGANTFAFFTRNPRGGKAKSIDEADIQALIKLMEDNKFGKLVAHAPYTFNPCSAKESVREFARTCMADDLKRMEYLPGNYYNFHPGSHVGQGVEAGVQLIVDTLNEVMWEDQQTVILLETMAGKGSEVGRKFEELRAIIDGVELKYKLGVCLDTCHVSDAGYNVKYDFAGVLDEFDRIIGIDRLKALHINDSKNPTGAAKDRHEKIGEGEIGLEAMLTVVNNPHVIGLPCILETPQDSLAGYAAEIEKLR